MEKEKIENIKNNAKKVFDAKTLADLAGEIRKQLIENGNMLKKYCDDLNYYTHRVSERILLLTQLCVLSDDECIEELEKLEKQYDVLMSINSLVSSKRHALNRLKRRSDLTSSVCRHSETESSVKQVTE